MKTARFTVRLLLLLLLLTVYHCTATAHGPNAMSPEKCCFNLFPKRIPKAHIMSVTKTHSKCFEKAFVVDTPKGEICVSQTLDWAQKAFNEQINEDQ